MADFDDSDEEETFVTIGNAVEVPDKDEPLKKRVTVQDTEAKDSKGRARFHGAFTGGFSAGYFNSVGSKEGWTPSTFISSREKRTEAGTQQRPEDFMDDSDMGEYGIAPRKFVTARGFQSEERKRRRHDEASLATTESALPGASVLLDLIVPERITVGVRLLRKMGWKEGQGVGPRMNRKQKRKQKAGMRVYGCELPPSPSSDDDLGDLDDDSVLKDVTFAPGDVNNILLNVKDNTHGLGYRGLDPRAALHSSHINLFEEPSGVRKPGARKGIRGQGFGVGALEEDDDDIYGTDSMSKYDMSLGGEEGDGNFGWTGPSGRGQGETPVSYVGRVLEGFRLSNTKLVQKKDFPPPQLPRTYRPVHTFLKPDPSESLLGPTDKGVDYRQFLRPPTTEQLALAPPGPTPSSKHTPQYKDALSRSMALGEKPFVGSVFDLIPKEDQDRLEKCKNTDAVLPAVTSTCTASSTVTSVTPATQPTTTQAQTISQQTIEDLRQQNKPLYTGAGATNSFKPFAQDSGKQERYDLYMELVKQGHKDAYSVILTPGQTEWERDREKEEFRQAERLYKPLSGMMAMRFTTQTHTDQETMDNTKDTDDSSQAANKKMYGTLTRETVEWHPDRLLCKRFNVPDPYTGSNIIGLATVKRDKYSIFNFLNFTEPTSQSSPFEATSQQRSGQSSKESKEQKNEQTDTESKVDKELNKSKNMKSIFSHLMNTEQKVQKSTQSSVSFTMKSAKTNKPKEFKSIFSHLENEEVRKSTVTKETETVAMETDEETTINVETSGVKTAQTGTKHKVIDVSEKPGTPEIDLFRAIFRNTDSEDSSTSESDNGEGNEMDIQTIEANTTASTAAADRTHENIHVNTEGGKSLGLPNTDRDATDDDVLPGSSEAIPSLQQRLSPDPDSGDSDSYGPALPPPSSTSNIGNDIVSVSSDSVTYIDLTKTSTTGYIDLTRVSARKHKHKHKLKHKTKKEEKVKHKKSKHKKKHKKKEKKSKSHRTYISSSDTSGKDTDDDTDNPSDRELLYKLKALKQTQRMRATDFM